ncbi:MAG: DMT family transporter [Alphaproteobacteria bacterium]
MSAFPGAPRQDSLKAGILVILFGILLLSGVDVLNKLLGQRLSVVQILWVRFMVFVPLAAAIAWRRDRGIAWRSKRPLLQLARAALLVIEMGMFVAALKYLPLADVQSILASAPLMVVALSVPFLGETVGWRRWSAVAAGFVGVLIIVRPGFAEIGTGTVLALIGTAMWAVYQIMLRLVGRDDPASTTALWTATVGLAMTTAVAPFHWTPPGPEGWAMLGAIALLGAGGHMALTKAFALAPASALQPFTYGQLLLAGLFGWLIFDDVPDGWTVAGAGLIVCAGLYSLHRRRVREATAG